MKKKIENQRLVYNDFSLTKIVFKFFFKCSRFKFNHLEVMTELFKRAVISLIMVQYIEDIFFEVRAMIYIGLAEGFHEIKLNQKNMWH